MSLSDNFTSRKIQKKQQIPNRTKSALWQNSREKKLYRKMKKKLSSGNWAGWSTIANKQNFFFSLVRMSYIFGLSVEVTFLRIVIYQISCHFVIEVSFKPQFLVFKWSECFVIILSYILYYYFIVAQWHILRIAI